MSLLFILTTSIEFILLFASVLLLLRIRNLLTKSNIVVLLKVRKHIGFVIFAMTMIGVMDYSYSAYRLFEPANPFNLLVVGHPPLINDCRIEQRK